MNQTKPISSPYAQVSVGLRSHLSKLKERPAAFAVYFCLLSRLNTKTGRLDPSLATIRKDTSVDRINDALDYLEEIGLIRRCTRRHKSGGRRSNAYEVTALDLEGRPFNWGEHPKDGPPALRANHKWFEEQCQKLETSASSTESDEIMGPATGEPGGVTTGGIDGPVPGGLVLPQHHKVDTSEAPTREESTRNQDQGLVGVSAFSSVGAAELTPDTCSAPGSDADKHVTAVSNEVQPASSVSASEREMDRLYSQCWRADWSLKVAVSRMKAYPRPADLFEDPADELGKPFLYCLSTLCSMNEHTKDYEQEALELLQADLPRRIAYYMLNKKLLPEQLHPTAEDLAYYGVDLSNIKSQFKEFCELHLKQSVVWSYPTPAADDDTPLAQSADLSPPVDAPDDASSTGNPPATSGDSPNRLFESLNLSPESPVVKMLEAVGITDKGKGRNGLQACLRLIKDKKLQRSQLYRIIRDVYRSPDVQNPAGLVYHRIKKFDGIMPLTSTDLIDSFVTAWEDFYRDTEFVHLARDVVADQRRCFDYYKIEQPTLDRLVFCHLDLSVAQWRFRKRNAKVFEKSFGRPIPSKPDFLEYCVSALEAGYKGTPIRVEAPVGVVVKALVLNLEEQYAPCWGSQLQKEFVEAHRDLVKTIRSARRKWQNSLNKVAA